METFNDEDFFLIAGPCVVETRDLTFSVAETLKSICSDLGIKLYFKSSYRKANRTSISSFTGIGDYDALSVLSDIRRELNLPVLTDVHSEGEVSVASGFVDALQIPAFLSRQTALLLAAGKTGKVVNIKKGQFMAPDDMKSAAEKVSSTGNKNIWLTERGTSFGYHDLVVDFRSLIIMKAYGYPVVFDATHSVQKPSIGEQSGGSPEFIPALARAAVAAGVDGLFLETHPDPKNAKSDASTQFPLSDMKPFLESLLKIHRVAKGIQ